jgi:hypothetical protein
MYIYQLLAKADFFGQACLMAPLEAADHRLPQVIPVPVFINAHRQ